MAQRKEKLRLGLFLNGAGHHVAAWRHPRAAADAGMNIAHMVEFTKIAEDAKMDMVFLADTFANFSDLDDLKADAHSSRVALLEPITLLSNLAAHTKNIGLIATATTTYYEPFIIARLFASLDLLSGGRAGWNLVTSVNDREARNFGREEFPAPGARYARAEEFYDVVKGLWSSWRDDAFLEDKEGGRYVDPDRVSVLNHRGPHFSVAGPLNVPRSAQGHPVFVQAGASEEGKQLAARTAEVVFSAQSALEPARAFYQDVKSRMQVFCRDPDHLKIMPGLFPVIGGTQAEAIRKYEELQDLLPPEVGRQQLARTLAIPKLPDFPLDEPLPDWFQVDGLASRPALLLEEARRENLTVRQLYQRVSGSRGHQIVTGTPEMIADRMEEWFDAFGADGFMIQPPYFPGGLNDFVEQVIPLLRQRGRFRSEYEGATLRENLGLRFPASPEWAPAI